MTQAELAELKAAIMKGENHPLKYIFERNAAYCVKNLISRFSCTADEAEDIYVDAVLNFREKISSDKISELTDVRAYLFATCKNMYLVSIKKQQRTNRAISEIYRDREQSEDSLYSEGAVTYLERLEGIVAEALKTIPQKCQDLLKSFYYERTNLTELAGRLGLASANVAKVVKARCFKKLLEEVKEIQTARSEKDVINR